MKKYVEGIIMILGWFAVITQFVLMMTNKTASSLETVVRFFSFFTILTNTLVAVYFTMALFNSKQVKKTGLLTSITVYILVVGIIYQLVLRSIWNPVGMQKLVDELLHTLIPLLVLVFWIVYDSAKNVTLNRVPKWLLYPFMYLAYVLIRGHFSGFYPYPFLNMNDLGWQRIAINSLMICFLFLGLSLALVFLGKRLKT